MNSIPHVGEFMDKKFITFKPDMDIHTAIDLLLDNKITGGIVVDDNGQLLGILSEKDCLRTLVHDSYSQHPSGTVQEYMTSPVMTISPDISIVTAADIFLKQSFRRIPVVKNGELVGQVTRRDLLREIRKIRKKK